MRKRDFYCFFPLGRHACGGQGQLDMPERFLLQRKIEEKEERGKKEVSEKRREKDNDQGRERKKPCNPIHYIFSWSKEDGMNIVADTSL